MPLRDGKSRKVWLLRIGQEMQQAMPIAIVDNGEDGMRTRQYYRQGDHHQFEYSVLLCHHCHRLA